MQKYTKAQIKAKLRKAIKTMDQAQHAMDELRHACEDTNDVINENAKDFSHVDYCSKLLAIAELCGLDIEDTTIALNDYLEELEGQ